MSDLTVPPLPVVAYMFQPPNPAVAPMLDIAPHGGAWQQLVRKADAEAALASLQARLEAADRLLREAHADWQRNAGLKDHYQEWDDEAWSRIESHIAAIDAATQEQPAAPSEGSQG